jgi:hypothetical protein
MIGKLAMSTILLLIGVEAGDYSARKDFTRAHADLIARDKAWAEAYQRVEDIAEHWGMELRAMNGNCAYDPMNHYRRAAREIIFRKVEP